MISTGCFHLASKNDQFLTTDSVYFHEYVGRRCSRHANGICEQTDDEEVILQTMTELPFSYKSTCNKNICYRFVTEVCDLNIVPPEIRVYGCLDVARDEQSMTPQNILNRAVFCAGAKNMKAKINKTLQPLKKYEGKSQQNIMSDLLSAVRRDFVSEEEKAIVRLVEEDVFSYLGWFGGNFQVGSALYCMGFVDKAAHMELILDSDTVSCDTKNWFLALGDADLKWTDYDRLEDFETYALRWKGKDLIDNVNTLIKEDPQKFFCVSTRPFAFRRFGQFDPLFFKTYCEKKIGLDVDIAKLVSNNEAPDHDVYISDAKGEEIGASGCIAGYNLQRCALSTFKDLSYWKKMGILTFESESGFDINLKKKNVSLVDCEKSLQGMGRGKLVEVHVMCATNKISLAFEQCPMERQKELVRTSFLLKTGNKEERRVRVVFRDAHTVSCNVFAHLVWKLSRRLVFSSVVMTHRFSEDRAFSSLMWHFVEQLVEQKDFVQTEDAVTQWIDNLDSENTDKLEGFCIVPMAKDATKCMSYTRLEAEDVVFSSKPATFGVLTSKTRGIEYEIISPHAKQLTKIKKKTSNIRKCLITKKGGTIVPVSALIAFRWRLPQLDKATILLPDSMSAQWKSDMIQITKSVFRNVSLIGVRNYEQLQNDDPRPKNIMRIINNHTVV